MGEQRDAVTWGCAEVARQSWYAEQVLALGQRGRDRALARGDARLVAHYEAVIRRAEQGLALFGRDLTRPAR